jgi:acetyl-CoA carboxylase carboxyltransferase component
MIFQLDVEIHFFFAEATVPIIAIIARKSYGEVYDVIPPKQIDADLVFAWSDIETAVMGIDGAINIIIHKEIEKAKDKKK